MIKCNFNLLARVSKWICNQSLGYNNYLIVKCYLTLELPKWPNWRIRNFSWRFWWQRYIFRSLNNFFKNTKVKISCSSSCYNFFLLFVLLLSRNKFSTPVIDSSNGKYYINVKNKYFIRIHSKLREWRKKETLKWEISYKNINEKNE